MKILIPMAGSSERFQTAGYSVPKQFITIGNEPMIHWVTKMFHPNDEFIFVAQKEHMKNEGFKRILKTAATRATIVEIDAHDLGPLYSCLGAQGCFSDDEPLIISYCDFYQQWNYGHFLMKAGSCDGGGIAVFKGFHPASFGSTYFAYINTNDHGEMMELKEKRSFTSERRKEFASSGVYYVKSWRVFKKYAEMVVRDKISIGNEYYVSLIYNPMVVEGLKVATYEIAKFICWGTPEDLDQFLFWQDFFNNDLKQQKTYLSARGVFS